MIINRIATYIKWNLEEIFALKPSVEIYNNLATQKKYDVTIVFPKRVDFLRKALLDITTPYKSVLDLACGTGALIEALPNKDKLTIVGIDPSKGMLKAAKMRFKDCKNITLLNADFKSASFPKGSFDLITITHALRFVEQGYEEAFFAKIASWLKPNGMFLIVEIQEVYLPFLHRFFGSSFSRGYNDSIRYEGVFKALLKPSFNFVKKSYLGNGFSPVLKVYSFLFSKNSRVK